MNEQLDRIEKSIAELTSKIDAVHQSSEKMRKYFFWTFVITLAVIVLPLLAIPLVLPAFLNSLTLPPGL